MNSYNKKAAEKAALRRKLIVKLRDDKGMTFDAIGKKLKISKQRAHVLYSEAMDKTSIYEESK